ncbi:cytochrome P450 4C1-like isoform X2 [Zootermopsis nevadensis]|uniref:cytochrome P450 4C1-like isoform X2 n=1 Tax=Zootermopsis nevadensis TaxID=136037 RepID=UPI000B8EDCE4|nr:cytochrome P450 4C1-like isoform X2 [Zootermopsis nevadensis]
MLVSTLIVFLASAILLWTFFRKKNYRLMKLAEKVPGPKPLPFIGNVLELGTGPKDLHLNIIRLADKYGAIYRFWLGSELYIVLQNSDYIQIILSDAKNVDKSSVYDVLKPWLGTGLITSTGEKWKASRRLITPTFHFQILNNFVEVFNKNASIFVEKLAHHVGGSEFDIYPYITLCALDSICETSMGVSIEAQRNSRSKYVQAIKSMCDILVARVFNLLLYPDILFRLSSTGRQHDRDLVTLHGMTNKVIKTQRQKNLQESAVADEVSNDTGEKKRVPLLELLIQSQDGAKMSDDEIRQEVDTIMFAGHDTTASAMSFICWALAKHQHVQERVMAELKEIFGDSGHSPTLHDLQNMNYLEQVIKETLRLFPTVPIIGRKINEDLNIGIQNTSQIQRSLIQIVSQQNTSRADPHIATFLLQQALGTV